MRKRKNKKKKNNKNLYYSCTARLVSPWTRALLALFLGSFLREKKHIFFVFYFFFLSSLLFNSSGKIEGHELK